MKTIRFFAAFALLSAFASPFVRAEDPKKEEKVCDCAKDKEGKECGVDKDCCCTGKKAEKTAKKS